VKHPWRTVLFVSPLAILFGVPALVLWLGGELTDTNAIVHRQTDNSRPILHGPAYTNSAYYVKARIIAARCPAVLALGNSRVMEFRHEFFLPNANFYNGGGALARLQHFRAFLERFPSNELPKTLIIATDTEYFDSKFDKLDRDRLNVAWLQRQLDAHWTATETFTMSWTKVWSDIRQGKIKWTRLFSLEGLSTRIGLNALCNGAGFRNDGSYRYGAIDLDMTNPQHRDYKFADTLQQIAVGYGRYGWGDTPSPPALAEMDKLLDFCTEHHIYVVGFMPPYAHVVWEAMKNHADDYGYVDKLDPELRRRFGQHGFEFYNFSDCRTFGGSDAEAIDGMHLNERAHVRMMISMLEQGSRLNECASLDDLQTILTTPEL
jgi:hypothetical protein